MDIDPDSPGKLSKLLAGGFNFGSSDVIRFIQKLSMEVRSLDAIPIHEPEAGNPGPDEDICGRTTKPAESDDQDR